MIKKNTYSKKNFLNLNSYEMSYQQKKNLKSSLILEKCHLRMAL